MSAPHFNNQMLNPGVLLHRIFLLCTTRLWEPHLASSSPRVSWGPWGQVDTYFSCALSSLRLPAGGTSPHPEALAYKGKAGGPLDLRRKPSC